MEKSKIMIIIKGVPNDEVISSFYDKNKKSKIVKFSNGKSFPYAYNNVKRLDNPIVVNLDEYQFTNKNRFQFNNILKCILFKDDFNSYFRFFFHDGSIKSYHGRDLIIKHNILASENIKSLYEYYMKVSTFVGLEDDAGKNSLTSKYEKNNFISDDTVLSVFFDEKQTIEKSPTNKAVLFPFGCNLSQIRAVRCALENQVSVIEGPPGTGKTQTILNIIANLIGRENSVAIVSNNNAATNNVYEKLQKYGIGYIAAELGSGKNKQEFIESKQSAYPNFADDAINDETLHIVSKEVEELEKSLINMFEHKNKIASLKRNLSSFKLEKQYFDEDYDATYEFLTVLKNTYKMTSKKILNLWNDCQAVDEQGKKYDFGIKFKLFIKYRINSFFIFEEGYVDLIPHLKKVFYSVKELEIEKEIKELDGILSNYRFEEKLNELTEKSNLLLKNSLAKKYANNDRKIFDLEDLWKNSEGFLSEYPVILSSTYSSISSLNGIIYDYIIVDEASQVDLVTGVLAMGCAKNIVVVGDLKQLPNVITNDMKKKIKTISNEFNIPMKFRQEENSLLSSVCETFKEAPRTLLREHYRCHPKIIEFCNNKFYNNELIVMTEDSDENDVLKVYVTSKGNHARGHYNQRQIDEIKKNVIPELQSSDYGIITPYRAQTAALIDQLDIDIPISTVHKFQGRENDDIIISTVDNEISEFTDNPNMLNVAVSRAKNRLRVVISDNEKNEKTNIGDLVKYIEYNNFEIKKSDIFSVFDMLYKCFEETRKEYLSKRKKISKFDSENLMYSVIEDLLLEDIFSKLSVIVHQPLNSIIRDLHKLDDDESRYVTNSWSHVDFLIYNKIDKSLVLAIEVDGFEFHKEGTKQKSRDIMKEVILKKYNIPLIRFNTTGSSQKEILYNKLNEIIV